MAWDTSKHHGQLHPLAARSQRVKAHRRKSTATLDKCLTTGKGERKGEKTEKGKRREKVLPAMWHEGTRTGSSNDAATRKQEPG